MACAVLTPEQKFTKENLGLLKNLFNGKTGWPRQKLRMRRWKRRRNFKN